MGRNSLPSSSNPASTISKRPSSGSPAGIHPTRTRKSGSTSPAPPASGGRCKLSWRREMASWSIKLPDIGEGVAEAEVVEWHVKVGEAVREDQIVAAVMTDKATVEIPSPADGVVTALGAEAGQVLAVGAELLRLDVGGDAGSAPDPGIVAGDEVKAAERATEGADLSDLEPAAE